MGFDEVLDAVPDFKEFMTVEELDNSSKKLAEEFSDVTFKKIGESREGKLISCLKVGHGDRNALLFAFPHPNEPIGSMTVEFLSRYLAENPDFTERTGFTWHLIKAIDPDGAVLNEGWFKGDFDPVKYAKHYYRPASHEQMEWTFPVDYKKLKFTDPPPETLALMHVIDETKPDFMFSLHNAGFCGVYYYITHGIEEIFLGLVDLVRQEKLPLHQGEPEVPYIKELHPGIYQMFGIQETYDFYEENGEENPQELILCGTSSDDYLRRVTDNRGFTLVCEMPYFYDRDLDDDTPTEEERRTLVLESIDFSIEIHRYTKERFNRFRNLCDSKSKIFSSLADGLDNFEKRIAPYLQHAKTDPMYEGKATVAQAFDSKTATRYYSVFRPAMVARLCDEAMSIHPAKEKELSEIRSELDEFVKTTVKNTLAGTNFEVIPIQKLVRVQVGSALNCITHLPPRH
ncbi:MAG: M14 family zinc carboxypeptidase [Candidatus Hodarchaeota archaeon]